MRLVPHVFLCQIKEVQKIIPIFDPFANMMMRRSILGTHLICLGEKMNTKNYPLKNKNSKALAPPIIEAVRR